MSLSSSISFRLAERNRRQRYTALYQQFKNYTMIPYPLFADNLRLAERVRNIEGCVIECGVWRGGMSAGIAATLGSDRDYFLFDSFEGLPPAQEIDGEAALAWQQDVTGPNYHNNCTAPAEDACKAMLLAGAKSFKLFKGWFDQTLPDFHPLQKIALLRLDADWYESTKTCLESLFDHVATGGLIVLDDYYAWDGCSRALHDFLSRRSATERIRNLGGVCYLEKRPI